MIMIKQWVNTGKLGECSGGVSETERREMLVIVINTQDVQFNFLFFLCSGGVSETERREMLVIVILI